MDDRYRVAVVEKALRLLEVFGERPHAFTLSDLSQRSGLSANQTFRLLHTLVGAGWLKQPAADRTYSLGPRPFGLLRALYVGDPFVAASQEPLQWAFDETGETVAIVAREGGIDSVCLDVRESQHALIISQAVGARTSETYADAASRVLLASSPEPVIEHFFATRQPFEQVTPWTITDPSALRAELERIRAQGYAVSDQQVAVGMYGIAAPIRDQHNEVVGAFTLSVPVLRADGDRRAELVRVVREAARRASINLGAPVMKTAP